MRRSIAFISAVMLIVSSLFAFPVFADEDPAALADDGSAAGEQEVTSAVSPAFRQKLFTDLSTDGKLVTSKMMSGIRLYEEAGTEGLFVSGTAYDLMSVRILIDEDFDFSEKPEDRSTAVRPVGRISLDGLSDKKCNITVSVYLDDEQEPRASMLLRKRLGKAGWSREGEQTIDVLSQNITGKHRVSIGFAAEGMSQDKKTTLLLRSLTFCEDSIPVIYFNIDESEGSIDAMNSSEGHTAECYGDVTLQVPSGYKGEFSQKELKTMEGMELEYIRGRGNSTWGMDKKPYKVKFDKKQDLLGMGKNKHWVLLANRYDNSQQRNRITYWTARHMGMEFAIKCAPVEVVMNGRYFGSYLLSEQVRVGENRVGIDELDETVKDPGSVEITGGYLLNLDGYDEEDESCFGTERGNMFRIESPDFDDYPADGSAKEAKKAQRGYIAGYVDKTEKALFGNDMTDRDGHSYDEYLDEQSAADFWWIQEFSINGDAFNGGSNYLYKKRDTEGGTGKLYWGPLWDFDYVAWGNPNYDKENCTEFDNTYHPWMKRLRSGEAYCSRLRARWSAAYDEEDLFDAHIDDLLTEVVKDGGVLDQYYDETRVSEYYDNVKWGFYNEEGWDYTSGDAASVRQAEQNPEQSLDDQSTSEQPGGQDQDQSPVGEQGQEQDQGDEQDQDALQTYESEIEQLRAWILKRQAWVNENIADIMVPSYTVRFLIEGKAVVTRKYSEGEELGELPEAPNKVGYTFKGWYDKYGDRADEEDTVYSDGVFTGKYVKNSKLKKPEHIFFREYDVYLWFSEYNDETEYAPSYTLMPEDSAAGGIIWSVDDPAVAEVSDEGTVKPKKAGKVRVTAVLSSGRKNSYTITFLSSDQDMYDVEDISLNKKRLRLDAGKYTQLKADQAPKPHYSSSIDWITMDSDIASVDEFGIVRAKKPGHTMVIAIDSESRRYAVCRVHVNVSVSYAKKAKVSGVNVRAVKSGGKRLVRVTWNKVSGVSGYYVLRATKKKGPYKRVGTMKRSRRTRWTDKKVKKGKTYYYKVRPYTKIGKKTYKGKFSKVVKCKVK